MFDTTGQVATGRDAIYSLSIDDAVSLYARAGHPRTPRSIQRYCASGHLDAVKEATALGDKYFINAQSVARHLAQIEELIALDARSTGRDLSRQVASSNAAHFSTETPRHEPATRVDASQTVAGPNAETIHSNAPDASRPIATQPLDASRIVAGLEREVERALEDRDFLREQIKTKDKQIDALLERDRETNILVRGLQEMLTPLLGPLRSDARDASDAYNA
ncbi:MAG: hypothetical protein ACKVP4_08520 [Hyphomicrobium sp.]